MNKLPKELFEEGTKKIRKKIKISIRTLVEFILVQGDIDNRKGKSMNTEAMQEGSRIHRKIQKSMGSNYEAEQTLSIELEILGDEYEFDLVIEGRADGIITNESDDRKKTIDEIKSMYMDVTQLEEGIEVHLAQAKCYAYILAKDLQLDEIGVQLTYVSIESEKKRYFHYNYEIDELQHWFYTLVTEYSKWAIWQYLWEKERTKTIKKTEFPFSYREGQKELVRDVYRTIIREKRLFIQAPTGVGKTISTVFPMVKAMGEGEIEKIFYLTAKTITRTVAEETAQILQRKGLRLKTVTLTAKDKLCILDKPNCNPIACERAKGHFDRINDAVYDVITHEDEISRDVILEYAKKYSVCPFELSLDITNWADYIVCDYNYVFDPNVYLKRFFHGDKQRPYGFLIDEAHNLVDRGRQMYSASLVKGDFLKVEKLVKEKSRKLGAAISVCNKELLSLRRECDDYKEITNISDFVFHLLRAASLYDEYLKEYVVLAEEEEIIILYFNIMHFLRIFELYDDKYICYTDYDENNEFRIKLLCMDPSTNLNNSLSKGKSSIFFSATFLPITYYKEQLGGREEDYAIYATTPFQEEKRKILIGTNVSTKYNRRTEKEYENIANYIKAFVGVKEGNYLVFLPSYQMMEQIALRCEEGMDGVVVQGTSMSEGEREEFLESFVSNPKKTRVGFCVMGGIFSEGIDLKGDRLIGTVIVGTGLPMISNENELFRKYYDMKMGKGFDYAYLYPGMNKVLQSAGRVIRTTEDLGCILLLDDRFLTNQYQELFPREWFPFEVVNLESMKVSVDNFWKEQL